MLRWPNTQGVMGDDPPYLVVGTEVSAKYKGAFCEAKVRKVVRSVKCKVNFKVGGSAIVTDDQIRGTLRAGSVVEAKHPDRKEFVEACITKIQDCSQYTVVFDDGDITTLRRTALCLKSGRHFAESETLDQLPLTHPEHFGNPVVGSRRGGRRSRNPMSDESSDEEEEPPKGKSKEEREADIGKVVCVELGDKKKQKDNWFPGLVVHPAAQDVVRIRVKDEYLVRSFRDGRYFTVPKKEANEFTREIGSKVDNNSLKTAVDKALLYLDKDELPPHWDRDVIFGLEEASTASDSDAAFDSDSSDDEPREEKDHFVAQLYKFMDDRGTPINRGPVISGRDVDLYKLFKVVHKLGGCNRVTNHNQWKMVSHKVGFGQFSNNANLVKVAYKKYLHSFEDFYRKLGCTMVTHPRGSRVRHRGGRSLIRDRERATPVNVPHGDSKDKGSDTVDDEDDEDGDSFEKADASPGLSGDEKDDEAIKRKEAVKDVDSAPKLQLGPPVLEGKPSDTQLKVNTPRGKPKKISDGSGNKSTLDSKKKSVSKAKGVRAVDGDNDEEPEMLDVEDFEDDDGDKLTTTRSKTKEEAIKPKSEIKNVPEVDKKPRVIEGNEKRIKPSLTATVEKKVSRPSLTALSDKKGKSSQDSERKTVRSLTTEFEKKSRVLEADKKKTSNPDSEKRSRAHSLGDTEKKVRPSLSATLDRKKSSVTDPDKKNRLASTDSEKKIRPSVSADPDRKKVRPSLTADPTKKVSRIDIDRKREKSARLSDADDADRKSKFNDGDRKNCDSSRGILLGDSDRKSSKSDSGDSDKRGNSKFKKGDDDRRKQHARKWKDNDETGGSSVDDSLDLLPSYKNVCIGDKLKVYYGPTHESKVTYEAKVLEVEGEGSEESYLVHYTGWNNRYDEWIKRSRIADNLSWSPARGKRRLLTQVAVVKKTTVKKRTLTPARDGSSSQQKDQGQSSLSLPGSEKQRDPPPGRSSTPSSVTSSSSRTKSPAMRPGSARVTRNTIGDTSQQAAEQATRRKRTRHSSGQTDMPSDSDSDGSGSESEVEPSTTRKSARRMAAVRDDDSSGKDRVPRKKARKRETEVGADGDEDKDCDKDELKYDSKDEDDASCESLSEEKYMLKKPKETVKASVDRNLDIEVDEEEIPAHSSSKGVDLDLNQIRLELKGIDQAVKTSAVNEEAESDAASELDIDVDTASLLQNKASTLIEPGECTFEMEDIYEFKEPEPFEFEVRSKREPSVERTPKLQKRPMPRIFDDVEHVLKRTSSRSTLGDSESSADEGGSPVKKKSNENCASKDDVEQRTNTESPSPELNVEKVTPVEETTPHKKMSSSSSEDAFEKLRHSPSFRFSAGSPLRAPTPTPSVTPVVPTPVQSPPQLTSAPPTIIVSSAVVTSSKVGSPTSSNQSVSSTSVKQTSVSQPVTVQPALKATLFAPSSQKSQSSYEGKSAGSSKPSHIPAQSIPLCPLLSRPPVLAAAVKIPAETTVITKTEEWLKTKQQASEESEPRKDNNTTVKIEVDDSLPPLVPTALTVVPSGRSSPEPPQLLPIPGLPPQLFQENFKVEPKDVPMPQIKKESVSDAELVSPSLKHIQAPVKPNAPVLVDDVDDLSEDDSLRQSSRKKTQLKRKKAVSKEFVEDSDSDSSDEESRLVIDRSESSESESDELKIMIPSKDIDCQWPGGNKQDDAVFDQEKYKSFQKDDDNTSSKSKDLSSSNPSEDEATPDSPGLKIEDTEEVEVDNNLCSLFCEETIPGSPAPPCDVPLDVHSESSSSRSSDRTLDTSKVSCKVLEMPFASVPGNTRSAGPSSLSSSATTFTKPSRGEKGDSLPAEAANSKAGMSSNAGEAVAVVEHSPPATPDSCMSTLSNSPRGEHGDTLSIMDNDSNKSHRDSEGPENKDNDYSDEDLDVGTRMKRLSALAGKKENDQSKSRFDNDLLSPNKKRRRSGKSCEGEERAKRPRHTSNRMSGQGAASDSDDNSEPTTSAMSTSECQLQPPLPALQTSTLPHSTSSPSAGTSQAQPSRSPRPSKYNFFVDLAPELDASQRIALLQSTLQELRKTYASVKQQLACIDRRRKKLRRREREARQEARKMMREERRQAREEVVSCS